MNVIRKLSNLNLYMPLIIVIALYVSGCNKSHKGLSDADLFEEFVLSPIPTSVSELRICRPKYYYGKYVMSFKIDSNDVKAILNSRPFIENNNWEFDSHDKYSPLEWTYTKNLEDTFDGTNNLQKVQVTDMINLPKDENGQNKPDWFRPNDWFGSCLYFCNINNSPTNPNNIIKHVLIYNEKLCEAYYLMDRTGGL